MSTRKQEVVPSGKALALVSKWLEEYPHDNPEDSPEEPEPRAARLGLGAKYVPHVNVASSMHQVEKNLREKLQSRGAGSARPTGNAPAAVGVRQGRQMHSVNKKSIHGDASPSSSSDDEDESRAAAFTKEKDRRGPQPLHLAVASGRDQVMMGAREESKKRKETTTTMTKKKKKKKKKKK